MAFHLRAIQSMLRTQKESEDCTSEGFSFVGRKIGSETRSLDVFSNSLFQNLSGWHALEQIRKDHL